MQDQNRIDCHSQSHGIKEPRSLLKLNKPFSKQSQSFTLNFFLFSSPPWNTDADLLPQVDNNLGSSCVNKYCFPQVTAKVVVLPVVICSSQKDFTLGQVSDLNEVNVCKEESLLT